MDAHVLMRARVHSLSLSLSHTHTHTHTRLSAAHVLAFPPSLRCVGKYVESQQKVGATMQKITAQMTGVPLG